MFFVDFLNFAKSGFWVILGSFYNPIFLSKFEILHFFDIFFVHLGMLVDVFESQHVCPILRFCLCLDRRWGRDSEVAQALKTVSVL